MGYVDILVNQQLTSTHSSLSNVLQSDVVYYYGGIEFLTPHFLSQAINTFKEKRNTLTIILTTPGGSAEAVERSVEILRKNYNYLNFIIPDYAMSAGTIFCMAGDKIYMSPLSSLGPIDPQVPNADGRYVPALGYLEQVEKLVDKSNKGTLSPAELDMLRRIDLGDLNKYEQARNLTVTLLKKWLVNYKFKDWTVHGTTPGLIGKKVTKAEKEARAEEIAKQLGDIKIWHSHQRYISMDTLRTELKLKIEDYSLDMELSNPIDLYHLIVLDYVMKNRYNIYIHAGHPVYCV